MLQGYPPCGNVIQVDGEYKRPCEAGFLTMRNTIYRLIYDIVLSRPEDYLSVYQSSCNHGCLKCHSWYFSQIARGTWMSPKDILKYAIEYEENVTVIEPRWRSTMWHASDLCAHCGYCKVYGKPGPFCPQKLSSDKILWSPQGFGPARNIISFTGGDLYCRPEFYVRTFKLLKKETGLWIHIETNGYGLTPKNLDELYAAGLDSIWLDMKAYSEHIYRKLCGTTNKWILKLPQIIKDKGIILEIVLLYIPGLVELDEIRKFGKLLAEVDKDVPITLLAFFPEYQLVNYRSPTYTEMVKAYRILESYGLRKVRLGNVGVICHDHQCIRKLINEIGREHVGL